MTTDRTALEAARDALPPLLRCPFCNMEARWFTAGRDAHGIECSDGEDCPGRAQTNVYGTEHKHCAVDDWNTRGGMSPEDVAAEEAAVTEAAALSSPPVLPGWQTIETAPKDGTLILLGARNGVWLGKYVPVYGSGYVPECPWASHLLNHDHMGERRTRPTHWQPLPAGPGTPAAPQSAAPALDDARAEYLRIGLLEWAVSRWRDEVQHRPLVNVHRRTLDDAWRQVIRHAGGDPDAIVGPSHDARLAAMQQEPRS